MTAAANELFGQHLGARRVIYGEVDDAGERIAITRAWTDGTLGSMAGMDLALSDFGTLAADVLRAGRVLAVDDVTTNSHSAPYANAYLTTGIRSALAIPLMKNGRLRAILNVHDSVVHHWTDTDIAMADDMVDRTWSALESARAQARLRIEHDRSQSIFDSMTEGFALLDRDWTILQANEIAAQIARRPRSELINRNQWEAVPELVGSKVEALYKSAQASQLPESLEHRHAFPGGGCGWLEIRVYPLPQGELAVFFRDITERKVTEEKLKDADRRKDEFLAMLAHELRNPLAPIGAAAQLLQIAKLDANIRRLPVLIIIW